MQPELISLVALVFVGLFFGGLGLWSANRAKKLRQQQSAKLNRQHDLLQTLKGYLKSKNLDSTIHFDPEYNFDYFQSVLTLSGAYIELKSFGPYFLAGIKAHSNNAAQNHLHKMISQVIDFNKIWNPPEITPSMYLQSIGVSVDEVERRGGNEKFAELIYDTLVRYETTFSAVQKAGVLDKFEDLYAKHKEARASLDTEAQAVIDKSMAPQA